MCEPYATISQANQIFQNPILCLKLICPFPRVCEKRWESTVVLLHYSGHGYLDGNKLNLLSSSGLEVELISSLEGFIPDHQTTEDCDLVFVVIFDCAISLLPVVVRPRGSHRVDVLSAGWDKDPSNSLTSKMLAEVQRRTKFGDPSVEITESIGHLRRPPHQKIQLYRNFWYSLCCSSPLTFGHQHGTLVKHNQTILLPFHFVLQRYCQIRKLSLSTGSLQTQAGLLGFAWKPSRRPTLWPSSLKSVAYASCGFAAFQESRRFLRMNESTTHGPFYIFDSTLYSSS